MTGISGNRVPVLARDEKLANIHLSGSRGTVALDKAGDLKVRSAFFNGLAKLGSLFSSKARDANKETKQEFLRALKSEFGLSETGVERFAAKISADRGTPLKMSDAKQILSQLSKHRLVSEYSKRDSGSSSLGDLDQPKIGSKNEPRFVPVDLGVDDFEDLTKEMETKFRQFNDEAHLRGVDSGPDEDVGAIGPGALKNMLMEMKNNPKTTAEDMRDEVVSWMKLKGMTENEIKTQLDQTMIELDAFPNDKSGSGEIDTSSEFFQQDISFFDDVETGETQDDVKTGDQGPEFEPLVDPSLLGGTSELDTMLDEILLKMSDDKGKGELESTHLSRESVGIDPQDLDDLLNDLDSTSYSPGMSGDNALAELMDELETTDVSAEGQRVDDGVDSTTGNLFDQYIDDLDKRDISSGSETKEKKVPVQQEGPTMSILEELQQDEEKQKAGTKVDVEAVKQHNTQLLDLVLKNQTAIQDKN